jgi:hypothetical protein
MRAAWGLAREHSGIYVALNFVYYGLVIVGVVFAAFNPELQQLLIEAVGEAFLQGPLALVGAAYIEGDVCLAAVLTFGVNLLAGSFLSLTLPSLIVPFPGLFMGVYRTFTWGLILSPSHPELAGPMIPHSLTLILEGQAYILAMLAVWIQGMAFLRPRSAGVRTHGEGYLAGLLRTMHLYILVAILLAVSAVYEAVELIFIVPHFFGVR